MASSDVFVQFGADVGGLEAAFAGAKAETTALAREMKTLASEMQSTGAAADSGPRLVAENIAECWRSRRRPRHRCRALAVPSSGGETPWPTGRITALGRSSITGSFLNQVMANPPTRTLKPISAAVDDVVAGDRLRPAKAVDRTGRRAGAIART